MKKITERWRHWSAEDIVRLLTIYGVILFLTVFLVGPLSTLFVKAFQSRDGAFVGLAQFREYFGSKAMTLSLIHI